MCYITTYSTNCAHRQLEEIKIENDNCLAFSVTKELCDKTIWRTVHLPCNFCTMKANKQKYPIYDEDTWKVTSLADLNIISSSSSSSAASSTSGMEEEKEKGKGKEKAKNAWKALFSSHGEQSKDDGDDTKGKMALISSSGQEYGYEKKGKTARFAMDDE